VEANIVHEVTASFQSRFRIDVNGVPSGFCGGKEDALLQYHHEANEPSTAI
jgi:hypothetical protein